jgi:hypothetical protein
LLNLKPIKKEDQEPNKYRRKNPNKLSREEVELDLNNRLEKKKNKSNENFVEI